MLRRFIGAGIALGTVVGGIIGWLTWVEDDEPREPRREADLRGAGHGGVRALPEGSGPS